MIRHALEVSRNVAKTCRYYGIGRTAYYEWYNKYQKEGEEGLKDKSRRPLATSSEVVAKIVYLRQNYHFGAFRIQMYLKRYHDITLPKSGV